MKRSLTVLAAAAIITLCGNSAYAQANAAPGPVPQLPPTAPGPVPPPPPPPAAPAPTPAPANPVPTVTPEPAPAPPATATTPTTPPAAPAAPAPVVIDPKVPALLDAVQAKLKSLKSVSAEATMTMTYHVPGQAKNPDPVHQISDVKLMRPNYARISTWDQTITPADGLYHRSKQSMIQAADGKNFWFWIGDSNQYMKAPDDATGSKIATGSIDGYNGFFDDTKSLSSQLNQMQSQHVLNSVTLNEDQTWNGAHYKVVEFNFSVPLPEQMLKTIPSGKLTVVQDVYVGDDMLVHRVADKSDIFDEESVYYPIKTDTLTDKSQFAFVPPAGSKPNTPGSPAAEAPPLKNGTLAPDFTVQDTAGKPVKLSSYRGKVVVIDFWATWCPPCQASLPHTNEVAEKFKGKGVVFLAINTDDSMDAFKSWLPGHKSFDALVFAIDTGTGSKNIAGALYNVTGIPTQFVVDKTGKITDSFVGYGGPSDDLENAVKKAGG